MTGRMSARSSAKRNQASSPPKESRATRSTRSQSRELGESEVESRKRGPKRGARAGSEDSVSSVGSRASNTSKASSRGGRTKKATRGAAANRDLSIVAEDREEEVKDEDDGNADDNNTSRAKRAQSLGGMSAMSGTTAITSQSVRTSHSAVAVAELDPVMAEILPELLETSVHILDLLAPADTTHDMVDAIAKELKTPGSARAKKLRLREDTFKPKRELYGKDPYIVSDYVLRRLLGDSITEGTFRPDAILYAANLANLVKSFFTTPKESQAVNALLSDLDVSFPSPFVSKFNDDMQYGSSMLFDETFALGLDIRTQWTIHSLHGARGQAMAALEEIVVKDYFFEPAERDPSLQLYDDYFQNGHPKPVLTGFEMSRDQNTKVYERVNEIAAALNQSEEAVEQDDLVDFEILDEEFRWSDFLADLVVWSRARFNEIARSIKEQGGIHTITRELCDRMQKDDSQLDINYNSPLAIMASQTSSSADSKPNAGGPGKSLYQGKDTLRKLKQVKKSLSLGANSAPPSNQKATASSSSRPSDSRPEPKPTVNYKAPARQQVGDDYRPVEEENNFESTGQPKPTQHFTNTWKAYSNDKNKENRPESVGPQPKRRLVDRAPDARKMKWHDVIEESNGGPSNQQHSRSERGDTEELNGGSSNRKRSHDDSEDSEETGFEKDTRDHIPPRREPADKRRRVQSTALDDDADSSRRSQQQGHAREEARPQVTRREREKRAAELDDDEDEDEDEDREDQRVRFSQVASVARSNTQRVKIPNSRTQKRVAWSPADEQLLVDLVEEFGCSWSLIQKRGGFEHDRDQVALKDKARNMKVSFIKARMEMPENFEKIALGRKEKNTIRATLPGYESE